MSSTMEPSVWLWKLLRTTFYEPCEIHKTDQPRKKQNPTDTSFFCIDCLVSACELCVKDGGSHANHRILRVYKASRNVSVRKTELAALIDVSEIEVFSVNSTAIYFLNPRGCEDKNGRRNIRNACVACGWELKSETFCSIYCKVTSSESLQRLETRGEEGESGGSGGGGSSVTNMITQQASKPQQSQSFRKRSRKGVPRRAPFF